MPIEASQLSDSQLLAIKNNDFSNLDDESLMAITDYLKPKVETSPQTNIPSADGGDTESDLPLTETDGDTSLKDAATYGKTVVSSALGAIPDTAALAYNLPALGVNYAAGTNLPLIPSATHAIDEGIDKATGGYTKTDPKDKWKHEALSFATQMATPGGLATAAGKKGLKLIEKGLKYIGSTKASSVTAAGAAGGSTQLAKDNGLSDGAAMVAGLATGAGVSSGLKALTKAKTKITGHSPENIDTSTVDAAVRNQYGENATWETLTNKQKENLKINTTLVNKSPILANAEKYLEQTPVFGSRHTKKLLKQDESFVKDAEGVMEAAGDRLVSSDLPRPEALVEVGKYTKENISNALAKAKEEKDRLYTISQESLPAKDQIKASHTLKKLQDVESQLGTKTGLSKDSKRLNEYLQDIKKDFVIESKFGQVAIPTPIKELVRLKKELNDIIDWDTLSGGVIENYKGIRSSIVKDIETYGKTNQSWYKSFKDADDFYGKHLGSESLSSNVAKNIFKEESLEKILPKLTSAADFKTLERSLANLPEGKKIFETIKTEKIRDLLLETSLNKGANTANYGKFAETLNAPEKATLIKELVGDYQFKRLKDLATIAKAQIKKGNRMTNKSGTAYQAGTITAVGYVLQPFLSGEGDLSDKLGKSAKNLTILATLAGTVSRIISSKSMLNYSINGAKAMKNNDLTNASKWEKVLNNQIVKDLGTENLVTLQSLAKQIGQKKQEDEKKKKHGARPKGKLHVDLANKVSYSR